MTRQSYATVGASTLPAIALGFAAATLAASTFHDHTPPLLIGYGCEGSEGKPLYYPEEDMFPNCSKIERISDDDNH